MMSIFSSFDAVCAEYLGQKSGFRSSSSSFFSNTMIKKDVNGSESAKQSNCSSEPCKEINKTQLKKHERATRIAVELDGLNCFETIV
ncbi:hypothetical protein ACHQM5_016366 [Ranunculus cassubicifolius]